MSKRGRIEAWRRFNALLRVDDELANKWLSRLRVARSRHFCCALLNASWRRKHYADEKKWRNDTGIIAAAPRAVLNTAREDDSPWYPNLTGVDEEDGGEENITDDTLWPDKISTRCMGNENEKKNEDSDHNYNDYEQETEGYGENDAEDVEENGLEREIVLDEDGDVDMNTSRK